MEREHAHSRHACGTVKVEAQKEFRHDQDVMHLKSKCNSPDLVSHSASKSLSNSAVIRLLVVQDGQENIHANVPDSYAGLSRAASGGYFLFPFVMYELKPFPASSVHSIQPNNP